MPIISDEHGDNPDTKTEAHSWLRVSVNKRFLVTYPDDFKYSSPKDKWAQGVDKNGVTRWDLIAAGTPFGASIFAWQLTRGKLFALNPFEPDMIVDTVFVGLMIAADGIRTVLGAAAVFGEVPQSLLIAGLRGVAASGIPELAFANDIADMVNPVTLLGVYAGVGLFCSWMLKHGSPATPVEHGCR